MNLAEYCSLSQWDPKRSIGVWSGFTPADEDPRWDSFSPPYALNRKRKASPGSKSRPCFSVSPLTGRAENSSASILWEIWDFLQGRTQIFFIRFLPPLKFFYPLLPQLYGMVTPLFDSHCVLRFSSELCLFWITQKNSLWFCARAFALSL